MKNIAALLAGTVFGAGLVIGGMTEPDKVLAFLTLNSNWDATLIFVLGAAVSVAAVGFALAGRLPAPLFSQQFHTPAGTAVDRPLLLGAVIFGLGWGLSGFCPGPALVGIMTLDPRAAVFMLAYLAGVLAFQHYSRLQQAVPEGSAAGDG